MCYTCTPKGDFLEIEGEPCPPEVIDEILRKLAILMLDDIEARYEMGLLDDPQPESTPPSE